MGPVVATKSFFVKWLDYDSRSSRSEYWWATLIVNIGSNVVGGVIGFLVGFVLSMFGASLDVINIVLLIIILPLVVFLVIASFALSVRRLHDVGRSGWWLLLSLTIIGIPILLFWYCSKGKEEINKFGADPLAQENDVPAAGN